LLDDHHLTRHQNLEEADKKCKSRQAKKIWNNRGQGNKSRLNTKWTRCSQRCLIHAKICIIRINRTRLTSKIKVRVTTICKVMSRVKRFSNIKLNSRIWVARWFKVLTILHSYSHQCNRVCYHKKPLLIKIGGKIKFKPLAKEGQQLHF
jgi:hypothetical protein